MHMSFESKRKGGKTVAIFFTKCQRRLMAGQRIEPSSPLVAVKTRYSIRSRRLGYYDTIFSDFQSFVCWVFKPDAISMEPHII